MESKKEVMVVGGGDSRSLAGLYLPSHFIYCARALSYMMVTI